MWLFLFVHSVHYISRVSIRSVMGGFRVGIAFSRCLTATAISDRTTDKVPSSVLSIQTSGAPRTDVHTTGTGTTGGIEVGAGRSAVSMIIRGVSGTVLVMVESWTGQGMVGRRSIDVLLTGSTFISIKRS